MIHRVHICAVCSVIHRVAVELCSRCDRAAIKGLFGWFWSFVGLTSDWQAMCKLQLWVVCVVWVSCLHIFGCHKKSTLVPNLPCFLGLVAMWQCGMVAMWHGGMVAMWQWMWHRQIVKIDVVSRQVVWAVGSSFVSLLLRTTSNSVAQIHIWNPYYGYIYIFICSRQSPTIPRVD